MGELEKEERENEELESEVAEESEDLDTTVLSHLMSCTSFEIEVRSSEDAVHGNNNVYGALESRLGIPMFYGSDVVHGNNNVYGATIFPHNVGLGATRGCFFDDDINWMRRKTLSIIMN
ncbi:hypothetical protein CTI12_AA550260 [Artemisia annua]|uniref:Glycoside hydrolase family 3 N-terminal domain-containing protein n=1 Tax=Artemisia annua TaxID=35608 RepID=A0A2U1KYQ3_ARTAN|nr:hypothetical protein CTI12_AA550260 [Artemisia annua]